MKKIILGLAACALATVPANADYYRRAGGGYYVLYVDNCTPDGMRAALDNAVASRKAVITIVRCAAEDVNYVQEQQYIPMMPQVQYVGPAPIEVSPCDISFEPVCGYTLY